MKHKTIALIVIVVMGIVGRSFADAKKEEDIDKTLRFADPRAENLLIVDNIWGDVVVTGTNGSEIRMKARKVFRARSESALAEMEEEVFLDINEEADLIELYVEGPFRDCDGRTRHRRSWWRDHHEARYDFEIQVPRGTSLEVSTVNDGEIIISGIDGDYDVSNVNGGIEMEKMGGSGDVYTVNGDVTVDFVKNPTGDSRFGSLNGDVRLYFLPRLSADFYLKTFNGEVYSDYPVTYLPVKAKVNSERKRGRYVYKVNRRTAVRAGNGGPEIELDGFNGDMFILKK